MRRVLSSCMLMVLTVYQDTWFSAYSLETSARSDSHGAGIMTGIGFLGAGVIMKKVDDPRPHDCSLDLDHAAIGIMIGVASIFPRASRLP